MSPRREYSTLSLTVRFLHSRVPSCALIAVIGCALATTGCKKKPAGSQEPAVQISDGGTAPQVLSVEQSKAKKEEEKKRMQAAIEVLASRSGRPANPFVDAMAKGEIVKGRPPSLDRDKLGAAMFTKDLVEGKRKFAAPFFIVDESSDELATGLVSRNKTLVSDDPKEAGTLVVYWHKATVVGDYAIEGYGSLGKTGEKAVRHEYVVKLIDLRSPWRSRQLTGKREPPTRIQRGSSYVFSGGGWTGSIPAIPGKSGTVLDDALDACVGQRDQADFEPSGERDIGPFYHRHSLSVSDVRLPPLPWELHSIGITRDEKTLFGFTSDSHLWRWSAPERKLLVKEKCGRCLALSSDGRLMATDPILQPGAPLPDVLVAISTLDGSQAPALTALPKVPDPNVYHTVKGSITCAAFSSDGAYLVAATNSSIGLWPLHPGKAGPLHLLPPISEKRRLAHPAGADFLRFTSDNKKLITLTNLYVGIWDVERGVPERVVRIDQPKVADFVISPDGEWVAYGSKGSLRFWSLTTDKPQDEVNVGSSVTCLAATPSGEVLAGCEGGSIKVFARGKNDPTSVIATSSGVTKMLVSADGKRLLSGHNDGNIHRWELGTGRRLD